MPCSTFLPLAMTGGGWLVGWGFKCEFFFGSFWKFLSFLDLDLDAGKRKKPESQNFQKKTFSKTSSPTILSLSAIADSLCATITVVRPPKTEDDDEDPALTFFDPPPPPSLPRSLAIESWTTRCDAVSSAAVASSRKRIFGSRTMARAIAILWRWPPDSWPPLSPTRVANP